MIKIDEFVDSYKKSNDKEKYVKNAIKHTYIPFMDKAVQANKIVVATSMVDKKYKENSSARYVFFVMSMLSMYFDVEYDADNVYMEYDKVNECGMIYYISKSVSDIEEFKIVLNMTLDDFRANNLSLPAYLETKFDAMSMVLNAILEKLDKS